MTTTGKKRETPAAVGPAELKRCPFCGGLAELFTERWINPNGAEWGSSDTTYSRCRRFAVCGATGPRVERKYLAQFTKNTVEDFRRDPALRARVEAEHAAYLLTVDQRAAELWNERT